MAMIGNQVPRWGAGSHRRLAQQGKPMSIVTVGVDLAKNVFAVRGVDPLYVMGMQAYSDTCR